MSIELRDIKEINATNLVSAFEASDGRGGGEGDLKEANSAVNSSSFLLLLKNHKNVFTLFRLQGVFF